MSLTKEDVVKIICEQFGVSRIESRRIVGSFLDTIKDELNKGNDVLISGFGRWTVNVKKARNGRNPQTGKKMIIDARSVVTFKTSPVLRNAVNS